MSVGKGFLSIILCACLASWASAFELGVKDTQFTLDGRPVFMLGCSYYGALGASEQVIAGDLDRMMQYGFNWMRIWATWAAFDNDISAVDLITGGPREPYLAKLKWLIEQCGQRGMAVDVTLSRGNGGTGPLKLQTHEAHRRAVETLVTALRAQRNWYIDLSNERNIKDKRFTSVEELADLRQLVRKLDERRLVTASHTGMLSRPELEQYLKVVGVDFISLHRPRNANSPKQTEARTGEILGWMKEVGRVVPLHYDEPFRRGFGGWEPKAGDYLIDLAGARQGGAAGWCFHNGAQGKSSDGRPRRSFDLRERGLFEQLDEEEKAFLRQTKP